MTPYYKDGRTWDRVTEVTGAIDCEATAYIEKDENLRKNPRTSHSVTLPGTLAHAKIQEFFERAMGKPIGGLFLEGNDKRLFAKIYAQHKKMKKKKKDAHTTYEDLMEKVNDCYANFMAFHSDHPITPLLVEHKMFSAHYGIGGTVDMIGLTKVKGTTIRASPDPGHLPEKVYFKTCDHKEPCKCYDKEVVVVMDWKTSTKKQVGHRLQMSAYFCMAEELGLLDQYRQLGHHICWETWSILLGVHSYKKTKTPYQLHYYDSSIADFLVARGHHRDARYMTVNAKGKTGLKGRCMFCSVLPTCPDRMIWSIGGEMEFFTSFTRTELARLSLVLGNVKMKELHDLSAKVERYLSDSRAAEQEIEENIPEVMQDFERLLAITLAKGEIQ